MTALAARLAGKGPAAERITAGLRFPPATCDATASGTEEAQVRLVKGVLELALCGHHADAYGPALADEGWRITHDNRGRLA